MCDPSAMAEQSLNFLVSNGQGTCYRVEIGHLVVRSAISGCHRPSLRWSAPNWAICSERHLIARGLIDYLSIVLFPKTKKNRIKFYSEKKEAPPSPCCSFPSLSEGRDKRWMDARLRALHSAQCKWTHPEIFVFPAPFLPVRPSATLIRNNLGIRNGTRVYGDSGPDVQLPVHLLPCLFFCCSCVTGRGAISGPSDPWPTTISVVCGRVVIRTAPRTSLFVRRLSLSTYFRQPLENWKSISG